MEQFRAVYFFMSTGTATLGHSDDVPGISGYVASQDPGGLLETMGLPKGFTARQGSPRG